MRAVRRVRLSAEIKLFSGKVTPLVNSKCRIWTKVPRKLISQLLNRKLILSTFSKMCLSVYSKNRRSQQIRYSKSYNAISVKQVRSNIWKVRRNIWKQLIKSINLKTTLSWLNKNLLTSACKVGSLFCRKQKRTY